MTNELLIAYGAAAVVFFGLDMIWLSSMNGFYRREIGHLLSDKPNWMVAAGFYLVFLVGLTIFVIAPRLGTGDWQGAALYGALFGFFTYATYDLTNLSTAKNFSPKLAVVDMAWGAALSASDATAGVLASGYFA